MVKAKSTPTVVNTILLKINRPTLVNMCVYTLGTNLQNMTVISLAGVKIFLKKFSGLLFVLDCIM